MTERQLGAWLGSPENEHLEFKEAKCNFHFEKPVKYCAALANEGGGSIVLGVTDKIPRQVVGTSAFRNVERCKAGLIERLHLRIDVVQVCHEDGRVVVVSVPARPPGLPLSVRGAYWMRAGEELVPMTPDMLRRIFDETGPDYSAEVCGAACLADLDTKAVDAFRERWYQKAKSHQIQYTTREQLLRDAELLTDEGVTHAALILLGTHSGLARTIHDLDASDGDLSVQDRKPGGLLGIASFRRPSWVAFISRSRPELEISSSDRR